MVGLQVVPTPSSGLKAVLCPEQQRVGASATHVFGNWRLCFVGQKSFNICQAHNNMTVCQFPFTSVYIKNLCYCSMLWSWRWVEKRRRGCVTTLSLDCCEQFPSKSGVQWFTNFQNLVAPIKVWGFFLSFRVSTDIRHQNIWSHAHNRG